MWCCVAGQVVLDVSEDHAAYSFRCSMLLQNVGTFPGQVLALVAFPGLDMQVLWSHLEENLYYKENMILGAWETENLSGTYC